MSDTIYREDAIKVIKDNSFAPGVDYLEINGYGAIDDIRALPSADRPQGEWIVDTQKNWLGMDVDCFRCSACGSDAIGWNLILDTKGLSYCPTCGAKMKGADDE